MNPKVSLILILDQWEKKVNPCQLAHSDNQKPPGVQSLHSRPQGGKVISWLQLSLLAKKIFTTRSISGVVKRQPHTYAFLQAMGDHGE
ncbi:hypothetical protein HanRHA438_Chr07g0311541 [Helianthus annuus]|nr:hypothetical protein HanXRQr2_Chr07g0301621 [Helianthus annuus]KAJ0563615.1 hypothetical protein HanHA89_Chr07g0265111 [Helianthus annuus]KAJ0728950.1 hypothetical protein HanLR1_Chr07g0247451 [Helianthus annuus]KAJ0908539.1 hypothetical protein HanRHA438_Chr07g0311541 [Helianthus annuus]